MILFIFHIHNSRSQHTITELVSAIFQIIIILALSPLISGIIKKAKVFFQIRKGPSIFQPYYNVAKLLKKDSVVSQNVSWIFHAAPIISFAAVIPYIYIYIIREIKVTREIELYVNISPSLIIGGILVVISYYLIQYIRIISELSSLALSASMSLISSDFSS